MKIVNHFQDETDDQTFPNNLTIFYEIFRLKFHGQTKKGSSKNIHHSLHNSNRTHNLQLSTNIT